VARIIAVGTAIYPLPLRLQPDQTWDSCRLFHKNRFLLSTITAIWHGIRDFKNHICAGKGPHFKRFLRIWYIFSQFAPLSELVLSLLYYWLRRRFPFRKYKNPWFFPGLCARVSFTGFGLKFLSVHPFLIQPVCSAHSIFLESIFDLENRRLY
jgi:hypothetical protein